MPIIKRYSNRKLYDTEAKHYITLEGLGELIRQGADVRITDHETGEDITALILAQTIFDLEKKLKGNLPGAVLTGLIRAGSDTITQLREAFAPDDVARINDEIERRIRLLIEQGQIGEPEGWRLLNLMLGAGQPEAEPQPASDQGLLRQLKKRGFASRGDLERLNRQVKSLSAELQTLSAPPPSRRSAKPKAARAKRPARRK